MNGGTFITRADEGIGAGPFDSVAWALEVHVKIPDAGQYRASVLYGSEDCPERIDFYTQAQPKVTDKVAFTWNRPEVKE
jgi:hypothetical protein